MMPPTRPPDHELEADAPYFTVARHKLIVMSTTTLLLYQIYWFYRNYQLLRERTGGGSPFWRAVAAPITARSLFSHVRTDAQSRMIPVAWSVGGLALIYLALTLLCFFEYPWWTLTLGSVLAIVPVNATMEAVNRVAAPTAVRITRYSVLDLVCIAVGIALTLLALHYTRLEAAFVQDLMDELS